MMELQVKKNGSEKGRHTLSSPRCVCVCVKEEKLQIDVNCYTAQFLSRHGNIGVFLKGFGKKDNDICFRQVQDGFLHLLHL